MKSKIIFFLTIVFFLKCNSQKKITIPLNRSGIDFIYSRIYYEDSKVVESIIYDSRTGLYSYKELNFGFGDDKNISTKIELSEEQLRNVYKLYQSLDLKNLCECLYLDGKLFYKSSIIFTKAHVKYDKLDNVDCTLNKIDIDKYSKIETLVYDFITSSPAYKKTFYWEFIKK